MAWPPSKLTPEQRDRLLRHEELGLSSSELAAELHCSVSYVTELAREGGAPFRHPAHFFAAEDLEILRESSERGLSPREVREKLPKFSETQIAQAARRRHWRLTNLYTRQRQLDASGSEVVLHEREYRNGQVSQFWEDNGPDILRLARSQRGKKTIGEIAAQVGVGRMRLMGFLWRAGEVGVMPPSLEDRLPTMPPLTKCVYPLHDDGEPWNWCGAEVKKPTPLRLGGYQTHPYCPTHHRLTHISGDAAKQLIEEQDREVKAALRTAKVMEDRGGKWKVPDIPA
jgi:AraC-like DNA-binding protein